MDKRKYKSFLLSVTWSNSTWRALCLFLLLSNFLLCLKMYGMETAEKTVLIPTNITQKYEINGSHIDPLLIRDLSLEFLSARLQYTPKTVATQFDRLAKHFHPSIYGAKKAELDVEADKIIRNSETSVFFPMGTHVKDLKAYVEFELTGYLGKKSVNAITMTVEIEYRESAGRLWIYDWKEVQASGNGRNYIPVDRARESTLEKLSSEEEF